jgi:hypothetical protein
MKYMLTTINTHLEATQRVMTVKLTRLTHKIAIQLHVVAQLYHLQFSLQVTSPETFGNTLIGISENTKCLKLIGLSKNTDLCVLENKRTTCLFLFSQSFS